jgi:hypothetical protein
MIKRVKLIIVFFCYVVILSGQPVFQLAPPFMNFSSIFFKDTATVTLKFLQPGTVIHYTLNGREPSENDPVYQMPLYITHGFSTIKARVFGNGFLPSESVQATFVKEGLPLKQVDFPPPDEKYNGEGPNTLLDNKGGKPAYASKSWLGFKQDTVTISITMPHQIKVNAVMVDLLQDQGSWIFFPSRVEVYGIKKNGSETKQLGKLTFLPVENIDVSVCRPFIINFNKRIKTDQVKLKLYILKSIPDWHPGKGQKSWIFIDEVKLY